MSQTVALLREGLWTDLTGERLFLRVSPLVEIIIINKIRLSKYQFNVAVVRLLRFFTWSEKWLNIILKVVRNFKVIHLSGVCRQQKLILVQEVFVYKTMAYELDYNFVYNIETKWTSKLLKYLNCRKQKLQVWDSLDSPLTARPVRFNERC